MDPIPDDLRKQMNDIAHMLKAALPDGVGFALLVFDFNRLTDARISYISNAERGDMLAAMREFIAVNEGRAHNAPDAKQ